MSVEGALTERERKLMQQAYLAGVARQQSEQHLKQQQQQQQQQQPEEALAINLLGESGPRKRARRGAAMTRVAL